MRIRVRLFAVLRETVGRDELQLELASGATVEAAWQQLADGHPELDVRRRSPGAAVNRRYVSFSEPLAEGDELVFVPPVSGG